MLSDLFRVCDSTEAVLVTGTRFPSFSRSNLAAAVALPQLQTLGAKVARWTAHEALLRAELARSPHVPGPSRAVELS